MNRNLNARIMWLIDADTAREVNDNEVVQKIIANSLATKGRTRAGSTLEPTAPAPVVQLSEDEGYYDVKSPPEETSVDAEPLSVLPYGAFVQLSLDAATSFARQLQHDRVSFAVCKEPKVLFVSYSMIRSLIDQRFIDRNETDWLAFVNGLMASGVRLAIADRHETTMFRGGS